MAIAKHEQLQHRAVTAGQPLAHQIAVPLRHPQHAEDLADRSARPLGKLLLSQRARLIGEDFKEVHPFSNAGAIAFGR
jgi:hypothetical protein